MTATPTTSSSHLSPNSRLRSSRSWRWWLSAATLVLLPIILGVVLLGSRQTSYTDLFPFWSDEIFYWHQAATFSQVGFDGGYYTSQEVPPPASFSHYYAWGLFIPVFYGTIGRVAGWYPWSIPVINIILVSLSLMLWISLVRPRTIQMAAAGFLLFTFAPFITFGPVSMAEVLHMAWGIALAAVLFALLKQRQSPHVLWWLLFAMVVVLIATGFRVTWGLLLPVIGAIGLSRWGWRGIAVGTGIGIGLAGVMYAFFNWTAAPYPGNLTALFLLATDFGRGLSLLITQIGENFQALFIGSELQFALRLQLVGTWAAVMLTALRDRNKALRQNRYDYWDLLLYTTILMGIFVFLIVFYQTGNDYRHFAPSILMAGFLFIARQHWGPLVVLIGLSLLVLFAAITSFGQRTNDYRYQKEIVAIMQDWKIALDEEMPYNPYAKSPWCNTLSFNPAFFDPPYLPSLAEPGIGLTLLFDKSDAPLKAQYLMLDARFTERYEATLNLELIFEVPGGALYRNLDADC